MLKIILKIINHLKHSNNKSINKLSYLKFQIQEHKRTEEHFLSCNKYTMTNLICQNHGKDAHLTITNDKK